MPADLVLIQIVEGIAGRVPDRPAVVSGTGRRTYAELVQRSRQLARYLNDRGLGAHRERDALRADESGQDLMAQYLYNGPEYLEGLLGGWAGRLAPFNVNYRYVADELRYLFRDAVPRAIQYHACFAPLLAEVLGDIDPVEVLLQIDDGSDVGLLPGAVDYEEALASVPAEVEVRPSPDDLYLLYTGGTTGRPKGVMWRAADAAVAVFGARNYRQGREWDSLEERLDSLPGVPDRALALAPYMHGAAQWNALQALCQGNTVVIQDSVRRFDAADAWDCVGRHDVNVLAVVGDAFGRPLADEIEANPRELPSLRVLITGGAALNAVHKERLVRAVPQLAIIESIGSSESGVQGRRRGVEVNRSGAPIFRREEGTVVVSDDMSRVLEPGHEGTGWIATSGRVPLGYLGDPEKTARTFPIIDGRRLSVPGDRARLLADDMVEVLGRDSVTINTGGEKVFAEEVEAACKAHPAVADAVVCGRRSPIWGAEVVALVQVRPAAALSAGDLVDFCAVHLARYKLPKDVIFVDEVKRSPSGKADYRWAVERATVAVAVRPGSANDGGSVDA